MYKYGRQATKWRALDESRPLARYWKDTIKLDRCCFVIYVFHGFSMDFLFIYNFSVYIPLRFFVFQTEEYREATTNKQ